MNFQRKLQTNKYTGLNMARSILIFINSIFLICTLPAQPKEFGANNYIEYQKGTLPVIISVSHGGSLNPTSIPDRTCNDPVYATDVFTIETAMEIKAALFSATGCFPHIIICHLRRAKLDCNRNINEGACGNSEAINAWNEFHTFIKKARDSAELIYNNKTLFVDLHGHGNPVDRIELGYLLYDNELELPDETLNTEKYINYSSIKKLVKINLKNYSHAQLLRGNEAFGTFLSNLEYPSVPSQQIPFPGTTSNYFSGGYITANHTSYKSGINTNGFQMELYNKGIRDSGVNREKFAEAFTKAVLKFLNTHFNMNWFGCQPLKTSGNWESEIKVYPNPIKNGSSFFIESPKNKFDHFKLLDLNGFESENGNISGDNELILINKLEPGLHLLVLFDLKTGAKYITKLIAQ